MGKSVKGVEALGDAGEAAGISRKLPDGEGRKGTVLHLPGSDHVSKNGLPKDGRAKTHAKSLGEKVDNLEAEIANLLGRMPKSLAERMSYVRHAGRDESEDPRPSQK
ncbi:hypothetical protein BBG47_26870 [Paenibacillus sp. KS1]|nr:hypothetical protein BBG47_26870 [Paenibacillus sp. KS1]